VPYLWHQTSVTGCDDDACRLDIDNPLLVLTEDRLLAADIIAETALDAVLLVLDDDVGTACAWGL